MKVKTLVILEMAIEQGVARGYRRAHKHIENPNEGTICDNIEECVMTEIHEYFSFDEDDYQ
jgi:predicted Zn-dependent protease with MMP-like domain